MVPFVGAGLSVYGEPHDRLPLWGELLGRLVEEGRGLGLIPDTGDPEIGEALSHHRYIEATDGVLAVLGEPTFRRTVEHELDDQGKPIPPAVSELVAVGWSLIVTTNLDRLIARAYLERYRRPVMSITGAETRRLAEAVAGTSTAKDTVLAQIHGSIDIYESWCLTQAHYAQLLQNPGYLIALQSLFLRRVFFVGFGLKDADFDLLMDTITRIYPAGVGEFYVLIPRTRRQDPEFLALIKRGGVRPIFYDVEEEEGDATDLFCGHRAVYECLEHLASQWTLARTSVDVTLKYFPELDPNMVERRKEIDRLIDSVSAGREILQVVGLGGLGKTSLILQFLQDELPTIAAAAYENVFGCSFYRADIGQFIYDMALATVGPGSRPLPRQVDMICDYVRQHRTLLVLDGLEAILDDEGALRSPYVSQILESVVSGEGAAVITSRIAAQGGVLQRSRIVEMEPFTPAEILDFLNRWGLDRLGDAANSRLVEVTAGHPLALRILAGVLQDVPPNEATATIERSAVIDFADEVDPLRENRLARIFGSYFHHLSEAERALLDCLTVFEQPAPFTLVNSAFTPGYPDTIVNRPLAELDLRPIIARLLDKRLLTASPVGELSCHPTVREYFAKHVEQESLSLAPIHRYLAVEALQGAPARPRSFEEAMPVIDACRHAAACGDWTLFDDLYRHRLMNEDYLCETLGAWEEALQLARLGDDSRFPAHFTGRPGYYPITAARCLKHLGRSSESRTKYLRTLEQIAFSGDPDTAMYVNNFLTLLVWRGELGGADWLVELNIRALSWIDEPWKRRWQIEHGLSSIAYLKLLQGQLGISRILFDRSAHAWDGFDSERRWIYDYYPFYRSELILLLDPNAHEEALETIAPLLAIADARAWPESLCRGYIQTAMTVLDRATQTVDPGDVATALEHLERARLTAAGMNVADVAIAYQLARLKVELARHEIGVEADLNAAELAELVDRAAVLVSTSALALATPEVTAARGALACLSRELDRAEELYERAVRQCRAQGNALALLSPRSLISWLGRRLGRHAEAEPTGSRTDPVGLVGSRLRPQWMIERLGTLPVSTQPPNAPVST